MAQIGILFRVVQGCDGAFSGHAESHSRPAPPASLWLPTARTKWPRNQEKTSICSLELFRHTGLCHFSHLKIFSHLLYFRVLRKIRVIFIDEHYDNSQWCDEETFFCVSKIAARTTRGIFSSETFAVLRNGWVNHTPKRAGKEGATGGGSCWLQSATSVEGHSTLVHTRCIADSWLAPSVITLTCLSLTLGIWCWMTLPSHSFSHTREWINRQRDGRWSSNRPRLLIQYLMILDMCVVCSRKTRRRKKSIWGVSEREYCVWNRMISVAHTMLSEIRQRAVNLQLKRCFRSLINLLHTSCPNRDRWPRSERIDLNWQVVASDNEEYANFDPVCSANTDRLVVVDD